MNPSGLLLIIEPEGIETSDANLRDTDLNAYN